MSQKRQLAAIMFTDIEGYTNLMQKDETIAIDLRNEHRDIYDSSTKKYGGETIQYFGDGTLSVFKSSVEAVECGIEMQLAFLEKEIPVRIGIHVGDIMYSEEDIIGDAVNVASRVESCAVPGSILISDKVHDQIRSHRHIKSKFLDAFDLKNVETALPLFAISNEGLVIPESKDIKGKLNSSSETEAFRGNRKRKFIVLGSMLLLLISALLYFSYFKNVTKPSELSIAVLPFENLSTDEDSEIFRDGITEDILTQLSKLKELHVISRTSVSGYKNTEKTIPQIAKELGVTLILEGSIRKYGDQVRINAQLINAENDERIWGDDYDKTLTDIFAIQSEISKEIVDALELNISFEEQQNLAQIPTQNIEAYKLFLRGRKEADKRNKESIAKSIELYQQAIRIDTSYAEAYAEIANSIYLETYYSGRNPVEASQLANKYLDKAETINDKVSRIYSVRGLINNIEGKKEAAKRAFEKAIRLSPNDLTARHQFSTFYYYNQDYKNQLVQAELAYRLDPLSFATANSYFTALTANFMYDEAEQLMKKVEETSDENNQFVINRSYFRLYIDKKDYKQALVPLGKIVKERPVFNRFLGFCYGKIGDTLNAYKTIDIIKNNNSIKAEKNHQIAVVFAGLQEIDSVFYYLDIRRNNQSTMLRRERSEFLSIIKDDPRYPDLLREHGITD